MRPAGKRDDLLKDGQARGLVTTQDGRTETVEDAVRHAVSRLSGGTGDVPKARLEEALKRKDSTTAQ